jgi:hypothetical protein
VETIAIGISSSLFASIIFLLFLRRLRPNIEIATQIAYYDKDGKKRYTIKLINTSNRNIVDIRAELLLVKSTNVPGGAIFNTTNIKLTKNSAFVLDAYDKNDKEAKFARRFVTEENLDDLWFNEDIDFLIFRIYCHDETSGFGKVFTKKYRTKRNSLILGQYHFGNDLKIS